MRRLRRLAVIAGLVLLAVGTIVGVWSGRAHAKADPGHVLATQAAEQAGALDDYFERARSIDLLTAHNPAFADFYAQPGNRWSKVVAGGPVVDKMVQALTYLQQLYPGRIGEACFIDHRGPENARVVRGYRAAPAQLSTNESANPFFVPTFGQVYQAYPYISPDTHEWVVSNSTLLPTASGAKDAIIHFEVTVESFRRAIVGDNSRITTRIIDARTGAVLIDGRYPQRVGTPLGNPADHTFTRLIKRLHWSGQLTTAGTRLAYQHINRKSGNANAWVVVVSTPVTGSVLSSVLSAGALTPLIAGLLLLGLANAGFRASQRELHAAALHDGLTGLPNRTLLHDRTGQALREADREHTTVGLLLLDLDRFKEVNDTLGHHYGDLLLCEVAARLRGALREVDTVARLGGDEFAVLLPRLAAADDAAAVAGRLVASLQEPCTIEGVTLEVEASIGIALYPTHAATSDQLLQRADIAMYTAKRLHAGVVSFEPSLDEHSPRRLALLGELRRAIEQDQLVLHYQPKADLRTGRIYGAEALVRWQHPEHGLLGPSEFIPLAERTELIKPLTHFVLNSALRQCRQWQREGHQLTVAVNVSARRLLDPGFADEVAALLRTWQVAPHLLVVEITESAIMTDPVHAKEILTRLCDMGVQVAIDDFGTGYSSMAHLKQLPIHELKVDCSFVTHMTRNPSDAVIVRSTVNLGRNLGLRVVAEGVEDQSTWDELEGLGCDAVQGYHLSRPLPSTEFDALLDRSPAVMSAAQPQS